MNGEEMWQAYCTESGTNVSAAHECRAFCGGGPLADELVDLVLAGRKTATASSAIASRTENEPFPEAGCLSVILFDSGEAACVIRDTKISVVPFDKVSAEHAFKEGEGDRSLGYRCAVHEAFFAPDYVAAGLPFDPHGDCVLEEFEIVYPAGPGAKNR